MSSYTYHENIPLSTNNPSDDQPKMQINTNSIKSIIGEDHWTFGTTNPPSSDGTHKWVRFPSNQVVAAGANVHTLFTANVSSVPQLFWYSGAAAASSTQYVDAASGSTFLFGGMILKWGQATVNSGATISFASAFPNTCYQVVVTPETQGSGTNSTWTVDSFSATGFDLQYSTGTSRTFHYIAIGK